MKLYLVRHGEAADSDDGGEPTLSERGKSEVEKTGFEISDRDDRPDIIFHSGKLRAQQTAEIIQAKIDEIVTIKMMEGLKPNDPVAEIAGWANEIKNDIMIVGHLPFMDKLATLLLKDSAKKQSISFGTACVACLERSDSGDWTLLWLFNPQ